MWESFSYFFIKIIRFLADSIPTVLCKLLTGESKKLPPITNQILLQPAAELALKIRKKELKSVDVVSAYISRIKEVQPIINAVVDERFEAALEEARAADDLIASGVKSEDEIEKEKPLLGVPFSCKETIAVKGMSFTGGLMSRKGKKVDRDSEAIAIVRDSGAIHIVSTNICELGMWYDSSNNLYGTTKNPYDTRRIPGGSSGGEGALIGAAGSVIGIGSDLGGSVRIPAFMNGIFAHKFSKGIISNDGHFPAAGEIYSYYAVIGPLCRYARDLLPMAKIMSKQTNLLKLDSKVDFKNLKIYYMEDDGGSPLLTPVVPEIKEALQKALIYFKETYDIHPKKLHLEALKQSFDIWTQKLTVPGAPRPTKLMADQNGQVDLKWEFLKWCFRLSEHTLHAIVIAASTNLYPGARRGRKSGTFEKCRELEAEFQSVLRDNCVFLYPSHPEPAPFQHQTLPKFFNIAYTAIFNILGLPVTQCPLGLCDGLPIGIQVVGGIYNDHLTIAVATELAKCFGGWISPCPIT